MPGGLFRSQPIAARSWELMESLWRMPDRNKWLGGGADIPGIHSICVDPRDPDTVRIAISCGGVWVTEGWWQELAAIGTWHALRRWPRRGGMIPIRRTRT
jgi:hypothetical protein